MNPFRPTANRRLNELMGLLWMVLAVLLLLALVSYHPTDASPDTAAMAARPANWVGPVGAWASDLLFQFLGLASFLLVAALGMLAWAWFRGLRRGGAWSRLIGLTLCLTGVAALVAETAPAARWRSAASLAGTAGILVSQGLMAALNTAGAVIVTVTLLVAGLFLATTFSFSGTRQWWCERVQPVLATRFRWAGAALAPWRRLRGALAAWRAQRRERSVAAAAARRAASGAAEVPATFIPALRRPEVFENAAVRARRALVEAAVEPGAAAVAVESEAVEAPLPLVTAAAEPKPAHRQTARIAMGHYRIPPLSLLHEPEAGNRIDEGELQATAQTMASKCEEFDVHGQVTRINPGPVVTTYEFKPEPGVKYNRITALNDDLCLALEAESIYIERIPGKSTVGIEVPNRQRETIFLREILGSAEFQGSASALTLALGKDINGAIAVSDLAAMPHLLIAGSTGAGKSVALNSMIVSLLYKNTPERLRLILVDPKRLELGLYDGVPHLYTPIITEPKLAANALRNATREMERRLKLLASRGVRNIAQYNRLFDERTPGLFDDLSQEDQQPLPYVVIVIDELADLMIVDANNVEESITRLAQMARAVGIHLILATQRPSVDVITGLIKANFPARISFRVATRVDSRTILDAQGAELLLGKGDMLFLPPGTSRFHRVHGALVTEREIVALVAAWSKQAEPQYNESFLAPPPESAEAAAAEAEAAEPAGAGEENDPLFEDAVRVVLEYGKASTSLLQRRLRIGYGRAAHLIDLMYADGIVGPADGPKPRELLKRPDWLREVDEALR